MMEYVWCAPIKVLHYIFAVKLFMYYTVVTSAPIVKVFMYTYNTLREYYNTQDDHWTPEMCFTI